MLHRTGSLNADIGRVSAVTGELLAPREEQLRQAESMPGWQRRAARDVLAETGPDMSRLPTAACHRLLSTPGARYQDLGADYYDKHAQSRRKVRHHLAELDALGYDVTIISRPGLDAADTGQTPAA